MTNKIRPPFQVLWSTDEIDFNDWFQRRWYFQQVLINGRMEDVRKLDISRRRAQSAGSLPKGAGC